MAQKPYYPDLVYALRETMRQLQSEDPNDPAIKELKKSILLMLASLAPSNSMAAD